MERERVIETENPKGAVILIRHGETEFNKEKIAQGGGLDAMLNDSGIEQAIDLGQTLAEVGITKIYSSDLIRATETAKLIGQTIKDDLDAEKALPISEYSDLRERYFGNLVGKNEAVRNKILSSRGETFKTSTIPGLESIEDFRARVIKAFEEIIEECDSSDKAIIVCHGGVLDILNEYITGANLSKGNDLGYAYANGAPITFDLSEIKKLLIERKSS